MTGQGESPEISFVFEIKLREAEGKQRIIDELINYHENASHIPSYGGIGKSESRMVPAPAADNGDLFGKAPEIAALVACADGGKLLEKTVKEPEGSSETVPIKFIWPRAFFKRLPRLR